MVVFDGINKKIIITSVTEIDVQKDIYSAWKSWALQTDNAKYQQALRSVGGDAIGSGQASPAYFFLMNNWKIAVSAINVEFKLNIYCEQASNTNTFPFIVTENGAVSYKVSDSPVITISSGSGLSHEEHDKLFNIPEDVWGYER